MTPLQKTFFSVTFMPTGFDAVALHLHVALPAIRSICSPVRLVCFSTMFVLTASIRRTSGDQFFAQSGFWGAWFWKLKSDQQAHVLRVVTPKKKAINSA